VVAEILGSTLARQRKGSAFYFTVGTGELS